MLKIAYALITITILASGCEAQVPPAQNNQATMTPTCENPVGEWVNELGSRLFIKNIDTVSGLIEGYYINYASPTQYPMLGWENLSPSDPGDPCSGNNAGAISFTVNWGAYGSITSWTGTCVVESNVPTIKTLWHLVRANSSLKWNHIVSGSDTFTPVAP